MTLSEPLPSPRSVSKFEADLLTVLRFLLGRVDARHGLHLVTTKHDSPPPCLSPNCVHLVQDSLAKGVVLYLTRAGGWRDEKFLERGQPTGGRVWNRVPLDSRKLTFSAPVLGFLTWLTAEKPDAAHDKWPAVTDPTPADELFFALAYQQLRVEPAVRNVLKVRNAFAKNPFCWLVWPADFVLEGEPQPPDFAPLFTGTRAAMLECLQPVLTHRWIVRERQKHEITDWRVMQQTGAAETAMLTTFLAAAEKANRPDLARFVLRTLSAVYRGQTPDVNFWTGSLTVNPPPRLADRVAIRRNALAFPQQAETLARWDRVARSVGYFDEEYAASQLWKEEYEAANGTDAAAKSKRVLDQLDPLKT
ncbi:hypothetical protein [Limnoglobus roseus]|uniref:FtsH ternary system domain-containing protein n=1 Tax=Limnoglobus roseus TaxID=2598579 RepID=A0A5C1AAC0_9BACT|nr:hypothetical protein [Limnoglobus roseus]QEL13998.1 hypothetical protein PX52LOC_00859 [Limnoglobus roseus]